MSLRYVVSGFRNVAARLEDAGFNVVGYGDWETAGRGDLYPYGMVMHSTEHNPKTYDPVRALLRILANGHGSIAGGPIANTATDQSGNIYLIATGVAWHAGKGGWKGLAGNGLVLGNEAIYTAAGGYAWTPQHHAAQIALAAEMSREFSFDVDYVCDHKEWAPRRKIDRTNYNSDWFRKEVQGHLEGEMALSDRDIDRIADAVARQVWRTVDPRKDMNGREFGDMGFQHRTITRTVQVILRRVDEVLAHLRGSNVDYDESAKETYDETDK